MAHEWLDRCLRSLDEARGSDLHVKVGSPPRIRVNGALRPLAGEAAVTPAAAAEMAAAILGCGPSDIGWEADCAYSVPGVGRFRANVFRQRGSVGIVLRRVVGSVPGFAELGLPEVVQRLADEARGLILVTGPTGSGKTTTLAAMIDHINSSRDCHIVTIEDPIEVLHQDRRAIVSQREVGFDTQGFAGAVRAAMRQDPDVILVGEMRDIETVGAALAAAETGHLVLSTLHTIDAKETINRIVDFFPPYQQGQVRVTLAGCLRGTICQRLVPTADGSARVPALEVMVVNGRIQQAILDPAQGGDISEIIAEGDFYGMQTFDQSLAALYEAGRINLDNALASASNSHDLKVLLQSRGLLAGAGR